MEFKTIDVARSVEQIDNPLNPYNGNLVRTLEREAAEGWELVSFNWMSWRDAILRRKAEPKAVSYVVKAPHGMCGWCGTTQVWPRPVRPDLGMRCNSDFHTDGTLVVAT